MIAVLPVLFSSITALQMNTPFLYFVWSIDTIVNTGAIQIHCYLENAIIPHSENLNVLAGILGNIIGMFFLQGNLIGQMYLTLLLIILSFLQ